MNQEDQSTLFEFEDAPLLPGYILGFRSGTLCRTGVA